MTAATHRDADAAHERRRPGDARRSSAGLGTLGLAALVLVAALSGVGGTYAMWSDQQTMDAGRLSTGTAGLEADWRGSAPAPGNLVPGQSVTQEAQLRNTGDVPLALSVAATTGTSGFDVRAAGACGAAERLAPIGATAVPLTSAGEAIVLDPDESVTVCIAVTATPVLTPGAQLIYTLDFEGTQVR